MKLVRRNLLYYSRGGQPTPPAIELPPSNQIWYEGPSQIYSNIGNPISHVYDSETGRGVLTYDTNLLYRSTDISANAFKGCNFTKIWWPASMQTWEGDCMHSCVNLTTIYAGSSFAWLSTGTCNGGVPLEHIYLVNNENFYSNDTGLVVRRGYHQDSGILVLGTVNLDIRNIPCTTIGPLCMADMNVAGKTLYFPSTVTAFSGEWNLGTNAYPIFTMYFYSVEAPTLSQTAGNIRCGSGSQVHIPVGSLSSYQTKWANLDYFSNITFIEDL